MIRERIERDLDYARNANGPMPEEMKQMILDYVDDPSSAGWDRIRMAILYVDPQEPDPAKRDVFLWKMVRRVDPTFPRTRPPVRRTVDERGRTIEVRDPWPRIPSPDLIGRAIEMGVH